MQLFTYLANPLFHLFLKKIDQDLADEMQHKGCLHCGSKLHVANYPRSPLGLTKEFRQDYEERNSFCCQKEGCRKRHTSASVRFFGRYRHPTFMIVLISALKLKPTQKRCDKLNRLLGFSVSKKTWIRWAHWWREIFIQTPFWKTFAGQFLIPPSTYSFPRKILKMYTGSLERQLISFLTFLSPLTAGPFLHV